MAVLEKAASTVKQRKCHSFSLYSDFRFVLWNVTDFGRHFHLGGRFCMTYEVRR